MPAASPHYLFAHGAGASSSHPWMRHWVHLLESIGSVSTFDYPYLAEGRKRPDPLPKLISAHRLALADACLRHSGPVVLIGKSMGGRIGCHLALEERPAAIVCFGYPLCSGGDRTKLRDEVLLKLSTPILFIQGTRDSLCPLDLLAQVREKMRAPNELHLVEAGDHSLQVAGRQLQAAAETQVDVDERIRAAIDAFVRKHTGGRG